MTDAPHAIVLLVPELHLLDYLTGKRAIANVPDGATLEKVWIYTHSDAFGKERPRVLALKIEHESFAPVLPGTRYPFVKARFRRIGGPNAR